MRKARAMIVVALVALLTVAVVTPATSTGWRPARFDVEAMPLPPGQVKCDDGRELAWLGTAIAKDGTAYGWAEFSDWSKETDRFLFFREPWMIFELDGEAPSVNAACESPLISGDEVGVGVKARGTAYATGKVTSGPTAQFPGINQGSRMLWSGTVDFERVPIFHAKVVIWPSRR